MDLSGFTEQGFKRKLVVQALFGKILYLLEASLSILLLPCNYRSSLSFTLKWTAWPTETDTFDGTLLALKSLLVLDLSNEIMHSMVLMGLQHSLPFVI
jgi:hypothetical protein